MLCKNKQTLSGHEVGSLGSAPRATLFRHLCFYAVPLDASAYNLFLNRRFRQTA